MSASETKGSANASDDEDGIDDGPTVEIGKADLAAAKADAKARVDGASDAKKPSSKVGITQVLDMKDAPKAQDASKKDASKGDPPKKAASSNGEASKKSAEGAKAAIDGVGASKAQASKVGTSSASVDAPSRSASGSEGDASEKDASGAGGSAEDDLAESQLAEGDATVPDATTMAVAAVEAAHARASHEVKLRVFGRTDVGQVREHNEDNFLVADLTKASRGLMEVDRTQLVGERGTVLGVCDGMGGAAAGEVASQLAVDIVYERMLAGDPPESRDELASRLVGAIETAGLRIFSEAKADRTRRGMGTTATIAALMDDHLFLGQVGDSRGYLLRGDRLVQVTRDQSLVNQLIEAGQLTEEEAETFEHNNIILQALGTAESVQVDLTFVELRRGDTLLLCSDGLSGMVRNDEIREVLRAIDDPLEACRELTDRANQAGGHDNVTVVIARFEGDHLSDPTAEDIAGLKYRKYELPEGVHPSSRPDAHPSGYPPRAMTIKSMRPPGPGKGDGEDDYQDELADAIRRVEDPVDLPREPTPSWVATMLIVSAVTCVVVAGYYLLR